MEVIVGSILLFPLLGFLINGLNLKVQNYKLSGIVATTMVFLSFCLSGKLFYVLANGVAPIKLNLFNWILVGDFNIEASFVVDQISSLMILVITGVGFLIHLFSIEYMSHDKKPNKYFAYLNFFVFNMLILVLGSNLLVMFVGWEGVGLASYLLIGFWFDDEAKAKAGMKAFVMNRIGDAFFLLGMFLIFINLKTLDFDLINQVSDSSSWVTVSAILLFLGATGKSAQLPLYTWLPDAMAGPTPVSALIHAATMVTAGVYMIIRLNVFYMASPLAMLIISIVGVVTLLLAASIAFLQTDIKKILAYSTISQLGYMFLAVGVGAFGAGLFHLITHAFFKALLFLGAGSVIHGMQNEQDITKMGGLRKFMPVTHITFLMGFLAIIGFPFFSGFFSKDEILWMSFHSDIGGIYFWGLGLIGALFTSFYMTKTMCLTFWGTPRFSSDKKPHESGIFIKIPLVALAILSVLGGLIGIPHVIGHDTVPNFLAGWLSNSVVAVPESSHPSATLEIALMIASSVMVLLVAFATYFVYQSRQSVLKVLEQKFPRAKNVLTHKYYLDDFYDKTISGQVIRLSQNLFRKVDVGIIDRITYKVSNVVMSIASTARNMQNGNLQWYVLYVVLGMCFISFVFMSKFKGI